MTLPGHKKKVNGCTVTPSGLNIISASSDGTLKVWDIRSTKCVATLEDFEFYDGWNSCTLTLDGEYIVSSSCGWDEAEVVLWNWRSRKVISRGMRKSGEVFNNNPDCAVSPDGSTIVVACDDGGLRLWKPSFKTLV